MNSKKGFLSKTIISLMLIFVCVVLSNVVSSRAALGNGKVTGVFYIDNDGGLYINSKNELYDATYKMKVADNVQEVSGYKLAYYTYVLVLTKNHKLYAYYIDAKSSPSNPKIKYKYIMGNVKELPQTQNYGPSRFCVVKRNGELWYVEIGRDDKSNEVTIKSEKVMEDVKKAYLDHTGMSNTYYCLKKDNTLWGWGRNLGGEIGNGTTSDKVEEPYKILDNVKSFFCTSDHCNMSPEGLICFAITNDNVLYGWGWNDEYELSFGIDYEQPENDDKSITSPIRIMEDVKKLYAENGMVVVQKKNNSLWVWGCYTVGRNSDGGASLILRELTGPVKVASKVEDFGLVNDGNSTQIYYTDKKGNLWCKLANCLDQPAIKCMKKVKFINFLSHVVCTKSGKLYIYDVDGKLGENGEKLPLKKLIASGM